MFRKTLIALAAASLCSGAWAAVSADEAKQLGNTLTPIGAEKAGNKDGTIPAYSGGLTTPPAGFKKGDGIRPDPFASEKPLYSVDSKNLDKYADKLTEGTKELLKRYPTFRVDVYPTHRSAAIPKFVADNTLKNATQAKTTDGGIGLENAYGGVPFPIPKNGYEVMWNHLTRYVGFTYQYRGKSFTVDASGKPALSTETVNTQQFPYYDPKKTSSDIFYMVRLDYKGPARRAGEGLLVHDPLNYVNGSRRAWQYLPGQRRVKLAPDIAYDTPNPVTSGMTTYDDAFMYNGKIDRYDFKLVGKKEMIVPYNDYRLVYDTKTDDVFLPQFVNPDVVRWELHRVWIVEATLKPDSRHIYAKRRFYIDEDSWITVASDTYDARGNYFRAGFNFLTPSYDEAAVFGDTNVFYDLIAGTYAVLGLVSETGGVRYIDPPAEKEWTADSLAGAGVR
jgi:hypothetical protein